MSLSANPNFIKEKKDYKVLKIVFKDGTFNLRRLNNNMLVNLITDANHELNLRGVSYARKNRNKRS